MEEKTKFEKLSNGDLKKTIDGKGPLALPPPVNADLGTIKQHTEWIIKKENISEFKKFVQANQDQAQGQINQTEEQLKKLEVIDVDLIPKKLEEEVGNVLGKGTKAMQKKFVDLNNYIAQVRQKKGLLKQLEYLKKQKAAVDKDANEIA